MSIHQTFENWEPPCISKSGEHCFVGDSGVCVNCYLIKRRSLRKVAPKRPSGTHHIKRLVEEQDGKCFYCGVEMWVGAVGKRLQLSPLVATVDHIVPLSRGGTNDLSNLVAACRSCNGSKGDKLLTEWLDYIASRPTDRKLRMSISPQKKSILVARLTEIIELRSS